MKLATFAALVIVVTVAALLWYHLNGGGGGPLTHTDAAFYLSVAAPYERVAPLFGAEGERAWAGDEWNPQFLYPQPARDVPGSVFHVAHGHHQAVWITPTFDIAGRHIQHVYVISGVLVTLIDITFTTSTASLTDVRVRYERTALTASANAQVAKLGAGDAAMGTDWQRQLDLHLQR